MNLVFDQILWTRLNKILVEASFANLQLRHVQTDNITVILKMS